MVAPIGGPAGSARAFSAVLASAVNTNTASGERRRQTSGSVASAVTATVMRLEAAVVGLARGQQADRRGECGERDGDVDLKVSACHSQPRV